MINHLYKLFVQEKLLISKDLTDSFQLPKAIKPLGVVAEGN